VLAPATPVAGLHWELACAGARQVEWHDDASGRWNPRRRTGSVAARRRTALFDGLRLSHGHVLLTGRTRGAHHLLAVIAHPSLRSGPLHEASNTLRFTVRGAATITRRFAGALDRAGCAGARRARVTIQLLPSAGRGHAGTVDIGGGLHLSSTQSGVDVDVAPSGGPTRVTVQSGDALRFTLPAGTSTPLTCTFGAGCYPASGGFTLPGRLVLSYDGRTTILAGLKVTYTPTGGELPNTAVTGNLDGVPVTIADDPDNPNTLTDDFLARVGTALGTAVGGTIGEVEPRFTSTGPL
jgi:hypothetical protein